MFPDAPRLRVLALPRRVRTLNALNVLSNMTNEPEFLDPALVGRITELRSRIDDATTDLTALLEAVDSQNPEVHRHVRLCLRDAIDYIERALNELEDAEDAAVGTFEPRD